MYLSDGDIQIPIELKSTNDLTAVSFSIAFDPKQFSNARLVLSERSGNDTVVTINRSFEELGSLGVLIDSSTPLSDEQTIAFIVFDRAADASEPSLNLADSPVRLSASDSMGRPYSLKQFKSGELQPTTSMVNRLFGYSMRATF